jgi:hypothetical protein
LPLAEFTYNNALNTTTGVSPFFANKGYNPSIAVHMEHDIASTHVLEFITDLNELHQELQKAIYSTQEHYQCSVDKNQILAPDFKIGDQVFIKAKFFWTT